MTRYEEVPPECILLASKIQDEFFPGLANVKIKFLFDVKKRVHNGGFVLGQCKKPDDLVKHFTLPETKDTDGYQYVITLDKLAYNNMETIDRVRLIRHELRHVLVLTDEREEAAVCKILPHNIEDFVEEIQLNADDPDWARKIGKKIARLYKK
jgi:hypothetical protein